MRNAILISSLLLALSLSGCLVANEGADGRTSGNLFGGKEKIVSQGDSLGELTYSDSGSFAATATQPDCAGGSGVTESHQWEIPETNADEYPWKASKVAVTITKAPTMPDIDLILRFGNQDIATATETGPDSESTVTVSANDVPPGTLTIVVRACTSANGEYTLDGTADMIASADVYEGGQTGEVASASPGTSGAVSVTTHVDDDGDTYYMATRQDEFTSTLAGTTGTADLSTGAGTLFYEAAGGSNYHLLATLTARGDSEQEARDRLAEMSVDHTATDGPAVLLDVHGNPGPGGWNKKQIDLTFEAPKAIDWTTFSASSSAGQVSVHDVVGSLVDLDNSAGQVSAEGVDADELLARTSAGQVIVTDSRANDMVLRSSAGQVIASMLASTASGAWDLDASAGQLSLTVKETAAIGYDVDARTSAGQVTFDFDDVEETQSSCQYASCHRKGKTDGYETRSIKVTLDLDISAGQITVGS